MINPLVGLVGVFCLGRAISHTILGLLLRVVFAVFGEAPCTCGCVALLLFLDVFPAIAQISCLCLNRTGNLPIILTFRALMSHRGNFRHHINGRITVIMLLVSNFDDRRFVQCFIRQPFRNEQISYVFLELLELILSSI